ncbi:MAG: hypothetical protein A2Z97_04900 [Bdellovibrionales bacterium GWB1_52_6]|nr:MAG: hypothetical protein A2Z97_04900 [Bdellovibrionales bacterium GWB1_52_6]OFZ05589.1 MAG: hypothetical protein A2X97_12025 [Bdellovibrionales bacterium GWA1_52_35]HCM39039.1 RND transporter [Bdellovibrionales bacterium]
MQAYIGWIVRFRKSVIAIILGLSVALLAQVGRLHVVIDPDAALPQAHPFVEVTSRIEKLFGNRNTVIIGVTARDGDAFQPGILAKVKGITDGILLTPGVIRGNVISVSSRKAKDILASSEGIEVRQLMETPPKNSSEANALRSALRANPVYSNLIVSKDEKTLSIIAEFDNSKDGYRAIDGHVRGVLKPFKDDTVEITVAGGPAFLSVVERYSARMGILFLLAVIMIGLIHYEAFRTVQALIFPLLTALLAVVWALGLMSVSGVALDVFNVTTPILILAVAAGHAVQMLKRYYEELHRIRQENPGVLPIEANQEAVVSSISRVGPVMIAAGLIAALGFLSLVVFEIKTIRAFGVFTGLGILSALVLEMTFIPALRAQLPAPRERETHRERQFTIWDRLVGWMHRATVLRRKSIYVAASILCLALAAGASQVRTDDSTRATLSESLDVRIDDAKLNERLGGSNTLYVLMDGKRPDAVKDPKFLQAIESIQSFLDRESNVGKTASLADFVKKIHKSMNGGDETFNRIPEGPAARDLISQYLLLYSTSGEPGDFDNYVDYEYRNALIIGLLKTDSSAYVSDLARRLREFAGTRFGSDIDFQIGGGVMVGAALTEVLVHDKILNIVQIAFVVFLVSSLFFRSFQAGALIMVPLLMTILANFGFMGLMGIPLQMATALTSAMAVGIGADYAIYLSYRIREELRQTADEPEAIRKAFSSAGKAILFVSSAVAGGYALLMLSWNFHVHLWMGALISLAMLVASISSLTLFPALLLTFRPKFVFGVARPPGATNSVDVRHETRPVLPLLIALVFLGAMPAARAGDIDAVAAMERSYAVTRISESATESTFTLTNASGQRRVRKTIGMAKIIDGTPNFRRMVRFVSPPDVKGTATLLIENDGGSDDIWIYLPALRKTRRIVASNKKDSFVGTDFSYGDMLGYRVGEWNHRMLRKEKIEEQGCIVIESVPKTEEIKNQTGYSKRISWVRTDNFVVAQADAYDLSGAHLKRFTFKEIRAVGGAERKSQPMKIEGANIQTGHRTLIELENFRADPGLKDDVFTIRNLERQ